MDKDLFNFSFSGKEVTDLDLDIEEVIRQQMLALEEVTVRFRVLILK